MRKVLGANFTAMERAIMFMTLNREFLRERFSRVHAHVVYLPRRANGNPLIVSFATLNGPVIGHLGNVAHRDRPRSLPPAVHSRLGSSTPQCPKHSLSRFNHAALRSGERGRSCTMHPPLLEYRRFPTASVPCVYFVGVATSLTLSTCVSQVCPSSVRM